MSNFRILYETPNNGVAIVVPASNINQEEAIKAVPSGTKYLIVNVSEIPEDRTFRDAWEVDFTNAQVKE
jgi:hypothetical protein